MPVRYRMCAVSGGRALDVMTGGAERGPALIAHHGTPGDASFFAPWDAVCAQHELRLVAVSRPGYATSTRQPGRRVVDLAYDVEQIVAELEIPWYVTAGHSGGGPFALASAAVDPAHCRAAATLAGTGPYGVEGFDFLTGLDADEFAAALAGEAPMRDFLEQHCAGMRSADGALLARMIDGIATDEDRAAIATGLFADTLAGSMRRGLANGFDGWVDDSLAAVEPWGFDVAEISVPVTIRHGDGDRLVPVRHAEWLAQRIPGATLHRPSGHGHFSIVAGFAGATIADLLARAAANAA